MRFAPQIHVDTVHSATPYLVPLNRACLPPCCALCVQVDGSKAAPGTGILPTLAISNPTLQRLLSHLTIITEAGVLLATRRADTYG